MSYLRRGLFYQTSIPTINGRVPLVKASVWVHVVSSFGHMLINSLSLDVGTLNLCVSIKGLVMKAN